MTIHTIYNYIAITRSSEKKLFLNVSQNIASFSGLSTIDNPFGFLYRLLSFGTPGL
jgi:hypothetical protein